MLKHDFLQAFHKLKEVMARQKRYTQGWIDCKYFFSQYYMAIGNFQKASSVLSSILVINPHLDIYLCRLGIASYKLCNLYEAF